jgi:hypothetical protein
MTLSGDDLIAHLTRQLSGCAARSARTEAVLEDVRGILAAGGLDPRDVVKAISAGIEERDAARRDAAARAQVAVSGDALAAISFLETELAAANQKVDRLLMMVERQRSLRSAMERTIERLEALNEDLSERLAAAPGVWRACARKFSYASEADAEGALLEVRRKGRDRNGQLAVYLCPYATSRRLHWHLGHERRPGERGTAVSE